eukprot:scaffold18977_cov31-Tisochrysis_lutea.AAC.1
MSDISTAATAGNGGGVDGAVDRSLPAKTWGVLTPLAALRVAGCGGDGHNAAGRGGGHNRRRGRCRGNGNDTT